MNSLCNTLHFPFPGAGFPAIALDPVIAEQLSPLDKKGYHAAQDRHGRTTIVLQTGKPPDPQPDYITVAPLACGICGADLRVHRGEKISSGDPNDFIVPGHEAVGFVVAVGTKVTKIKVGQLVVLQPHVLAGARCHKCQRGIVTPECIGLKHPLHAGWDLPGFLTDLLSWPARHCAIISTDQMLKVLQYPLSLAIFALIEPMACSIGAYVHIEEHRGAKWVSGFGPRKRALIFGAGPIGLIHAILLHEKGFEVVLKDLVKERIALARSRLGEWVLEYDPDQAQDSFHLVMLAASSAAPIAEAERLVADGGIIYSFAGLPPQEMQATDYNGVINIEDLHRKAEWIDKRVYNKKVSWGGHSGYYSSSFSLAISKVVRHADKLNRIVTGVISGLTSSTIHSLIPGGQDIVVPNDDVLPHVLSDLSLTRSHLKLVVLLGPPYLSKVLS